MRATILWALGIAAILVVALASTAAAQNNATTTYQEPDSEILLPSAEDTATGAYTTEDEDSSTIAVMSTAIKEVEPDKVIVLLAVETTGEAVGSAVEANAETMDNVINAVLGAGAQEDEVSTSNFAVYPNHSFDEFGMMVSGEITDYTVTNTIQIESTGIENVSIWIDAAVEAGANRVDSVVFTLSDERVEQVKTDLVAEAVGKAEARAVAMASALDMTILALKEAFLEDYDYYGYPTPYDLANSYGPYGTTIIIPPKQTVSITVHLTYSVAE